MTPKVEYSMTEFGESLIPIINDLCCWTKEYDEKNNIKV
jgi:DNA-binding HxlR family transcriptional regulator